MTIAIDGRTITGDRSGVGGYAERLVRSLLECDTVNRYILFLVEPNDQLDAPNLTKVLIAGYQRMILNRYWENIILPREARRYAIDIFFDPAYALPYLPRFGKLLHRLPLPPVLEYMFNTRRRVKYVVTIHDVISFIHPEYFTGKMRMWQHFFVWNSQRVADRVITDSISTQNDLLRLFPSYNGRVSVIYPELDHRFAVISDADQLQKARTRYRLPDQFVLYVGTVEPRKNVVGLARAYAALPGHIRKDYPLIIGGGIGWYAESIMSEVRSLRIDADVRFIGYVEHDHLPALFTLATLFVFPSFYEGFGYPPLEAMACGTPVVCSDRPSLPEAVGEAAIMIDPENHQSITDAMSMVLTSEDLREELRRKGLQQAERFGWTTCARKTLRLFEEVQNNREKMV